MRKDYEQMEELLAKKFAGEASMEEMAELDAWVKASPDNARYAADLAWVWAQAPKGEVALPAVDTERALQRVKQHLRRPKGLKALLRPWPLAAAAALALALGAILFFQSQPGDATQFATTDNQTLTETLADGSIVTLNQNSGLEIDPTFNRKERRTRLRGEAYFSIAPNAERPFVVAVNRLEVKVVGTKFNILEKKDQNQVEVSVLEGRVELRAGNQRVLLGAGKAALFDGNSEKILPLDQQNPNVLAYQNRSFRFDGTPLKTVAKDIEKVYGVTVEFAKPELADCRLSAQYDHLSLTEITEVIAETFNFSIQRTQDKVIFDGQGCEE